MTDTEAARRRHARGLAMLAVVVLAWGTCWPVNKALLDHMPPLWSLALRSVVSSIALFAISIAVTGLAVPKKHDAPVLVSMVLLHMVGFAVLATLALQFVQAGRSTVLAYTSVLWAPLFAALFLGERVSPRRVIGLGLGILGLVVIFNPLTFDWSDGRAVFGNAALLAGALLWGISIVHNRAHSWRATAFQLAPWQALLAAVILDRHRCGDRRRAGDRLERALRAAAAVCRHSGHGAGLLGRGGRLLFAAGRHHLDRIARHAGRQRHRVDGHAGRAADGAADPCPRADPGRRDRRHVRIIDRQTVAFAPTPW